MSKTPERLETDLPETVEDQHAALVRSAQASVSVKEAASIMGISSRSVYGSIQAGKLLSVRVGNTIRVSVASARAYQRPSVGRPRSRVPTWRTPVAGNLQYLLSITVRVRQGQQEHLARRLEEIRMGQKHQLPGTVARYIVQKEADPEQVQIVLVWRQLAMPPDEERAAALAAFQAELADILDWETACSTEGCVVMNT